MMKLILIRHGQTEWNISGKYQGQTDVSLSEAGMEQARQLARNFPVDELDVVYSSDLQRASATAECIAARFGCQVQLDRSLRELNFGDWEGLTYEEIVANWPEAMENFLQHPDRLEIPHGETFAMVQERAMAKVRQIVTEHEGQTAALVAHGAVLRTILAAILHMPLQYVWTIRQFNTAVNIVRFDDGFPTVELVNSTAHLTASA